MTFVLILLPLWQLDETHLFVVMTAWWIIWGTAWWMLRTYRRHLVALVLFLPVAGLISEALFRVQVFGVQGLLFDEYRPAGYASPWSNFQYSGDTYTGLKGGQTLIFKGAPYRVNHYGFRGKDIPHEKPAGVYRIVATGASAPMGAGVGDDDTFLARLETKLDEAWADHRVEVVNLSMGGASMGNMLHTLRRVGMAYQPDLILFMVDRGGLREDPSTEPHLRARKVEAPLWRRIAEPRYSFFSGRFFLFQAAHSLAVQQRNQFINKWTRFTVAGRYGRIPPVRAQRHLNIALDRLQEIAGDTPIVLYMMRPYGRARPFADTGLSFEDYLSVEAQRRGLEFLAPPSDSDSPYAQDELVLYPGDSHPNALYHAVFAEAYFDPLLKIIFD